jgi:RNA polymerase sigma-70 factor (ECF subfamily)
MNAAGSDDAQLVGALKRGEISAAKEIYTRHVRALLRFGVAMTRSMVIAEDIAHDSVMELIRRPEGFDPAHGSLRAYLLGIARHRVSRHLRTSRRYVQNLSDTAGGEETVTRTPWIEASESREMDGVEEALDRAQTVQHVQRAIMALPLVHREVIAWCDLEGLSYSEVAAILGCPVGTVRSRLHRARALLAEGLTDLRVDQSSDKPPTALPQPSDSVTSHPAAEIPPRGAAP